MSVALYMDAHVPGAITQALRQHGVDLLTAQEDGTAELEDADLLSRATALSRPLFSLFSQDSDLLAEARHRQSAQTPFADVLYAHQQSLSIQRFVEELEIIATAGEATDFANKVTYLPLR